VEERPFRATIMRESDLRSAQAPLFPLQILFKLFPETFHLLF
jgi:hypothetical protein